MILGASLTEISESLVMRRIVLCLIGAYSALASGTAWASAFMMRENDAEAVATAYSGNVSRADGAATVWTNPAGMSRLVGTQSEAGFTYLDPVVRFSGSASLQGFAVPGDNGGDAGVAKLAPHLYASIPLNDKLRFGLAVTEPFVNGVHYDRPWSSTEKRESRLVVIGLTGLDQVAIARALGV